MAGVNGTSSWTAATVNVPARRSAAASTSPTSRSKGESTAVRPEDRWSSCAGSVAGTRLRPVPAFFLPRAADADQTERLYEALAEFAGCEPAPPGARVAAVAFELDGARWVAAVGEELAGTRTTGQMRRGEVLEHTVELTSATRVLAIYPGTPCTVVTDAAPITGATSDWANPFTVIPDEVTLFTG